MEDAGDLSRLADIVVPPPVPWWPPAPGWWLLLAALIAGLLILLLAAIRHWRRNAYRRAALDEIDALPPADAANVTALATILKRTALAAYPRAEVASLTGRAWLAFLDRTSGSEEFTRNGDSLAQAAYGRPAGDDTPLLAAARRWVKHHRVEG